jgi:hypothetical protein
MKSGFVRGALFGALVGSVVFVSSAALAGSGVGGVFNLGVSNRVNGQTTLSGATAGKQLQVSNSSSAAGAAGIGISVASGKPPLVVSSSTQVKNLNASLLQGLPATSFLQGTGSVHGVRLTIPSGSSTGLGPVADLGSMVAECGTNGFPDAGILYGTNKAQLVVEENSSMTGVATNLGLATSFALVPSSKADMATAEFSAGNEVVVATIAWGDHLTGSTSGDCDFIVQIHNSIG